MDIPTPSYSPMRARPIAELLPGIKALLSKESVIMLSSKKKATASNIHQTRTNEKNIKPMTIAEMKALRGPTPRKFPQQSTSTKTKPWNSSVKVDKTKQHTKDGKMMHSTARKELNFHFKSAASNRTTMMMPVTRKSIHPQVKDKYGMNRISGLSKLPETPVLNQPFPLRVAKLKMNNVSFTGEDSFLQREKEINDFEEKSKALSDEPTLEKIAEISPPVSTPFKQYSNVRDFFDHTEADNSALWNNDTITSFDDLPEIKDNTKREESVIVSLCEMLNKATVSNNNNYNQEHEDLNEVERQGEINLKMIDNVIVMLQSMKEKQIKSLQYIRKLKLNELKTNRDNECKVMENGNVANVNQYANNVTEENKNNLTRLKSEIPVIKVINVSPENTPVTCRTTVIKSRSPSYKIPRRSIGLRKKVFYKSMPNVSDGTLAPNKNSDKALSMYMQIKEQMTFLSTPLKQSRMETPDTPAVTSNNLQKQLDKLYNECSN